MRTERKSHSRVRVTEFSEAVNRFKESFNRAFATGLAEEPQFWTLPTLQ